jgi:hypothetical protein
MIPDIAINPNQPMMTSLFFAQQSFFQLGMRFDVGKESPIRLLNEKDRILIDRDAQFQNGTVI